MTRSRRGAILLAVCGAVLSMWTASAQEAERAVATIKEPAKQYKTLAPNDIYRLARENVQADIRFRDAYSGQTVIPAAVRQVELGGVQYAIAAAFRTEGDLVCLVPTPPADVPGTTAEALRTLFGLSANWPLTPASLSRGMVLSQGQQLTMAGTIAGTAAGEKFVLLDSLMLGDQGAPKRVREMQVFWPGHAPMAVTQPGSYELTFPCMHVEGQEEAVTMAVESVTAGDVMAEIASVVGQREGLAAGPKVYGEFAAGTVYRHADAGNPVNVDFQDRVTRIYGVNVPRAVSTAPGFRGGIERAIPIRFAFDTEGGLTCLVPADMPTLVGRASTILPGEVVRMRGSISGRVGAFATVTVDYLGFPAQDLEAKDENVWVATLTWPGTTPRVFWDYGIYEVLGLPCRHAPERLEALRVLLGEFNVIELPLPPMPAVEAEGE